MASQQILFAETIAGMKKALKRKAYDSDSDSEIDNRGNRGNKLKRRARFARKGHLLPASGPSAYKELVDYAGLRRCLIYRNPPLLDEDGYELDSGDDEADLEEARVAAAELNPYAGVCLEHVLAPLTSATELPTHPTLSKAYLSKTLSELVAQSCDNMRKENQSLWRVRHLWTALCGDGSWMPCGMMVGKDDIILFSDHQGDGNISTTGKENDAQVSPLPDLKGNRDECHERSDKTAEKASSKVAASLEAGGGRSPVDTLMTDLGDEKPDEGQTGDRNRREAKEKGTDVKASEARDEHDAVEQGAVRDGTMTKEGTGGAEAAAKVEAHQGETRTKEVQKSAPTGNEADAETGRRREQDDEEAPLATGDFIHPMFLPPADAQPDRNVGLPEHEAEDVRRLLALYVQKQEEICRGAQKLHQGILKAERLRKEVLHWAKAEAHSGPNGDMSDGEDWYDKEEWGLSEDLKKGQDEEEEDATTAGKKTRNRR